MSVCQECGDDDPIAVSLCGQCAAQLTRERDLLQARVAALGGELNRHKAELEYWVKKAAALEAVIHETLSENAHLSDRDNCTLAKLKAAIKCNQTPEKIKERLK